MKKVLFLLFVLFVVMGVFSAEGRVIPDLINVTGIALNSSKLYIVHEAQVTVLDKNTLKVITTFGKAGPGPKEFLLAPGVQLGIQTDGEEIIISSLGKVSFFTLNGEYKNEMAYSTMNALFPTRLPNKNYLGYGFTQDDAKKLYRTIVLCDEKLNRIREVSRILHTFQGAGQGLTAMSGFFNFTTTDQFVFLPGKEENEIDVMDLSFNKTLTITVPKGTKAIDQGFKDRFMDELKANPLTKNNLDQFKPIKYPSHFPSILFIITEKEKLYVFTWDWGKQSTYYVYNYKTGQHVSTSKVTIRFQSPLLPAPIAIDNGILFQVSENDNEEWVLTQEILK